MEKPCAVRKFWTALASCRLGEKLALNFNPLVEVGGFFRVQLLHQLIELIFVVEFQPRGHVDDRGRVRSAIIHSPLYESRRITMHDVTIGVAVRTIRRLPKDTCSR